MSFAENWDENLIFFCSVGRFLGHQLVHRMMDLGKKEEEPAAPAAPAAPTQEELLAAILQELKTQNQLMTEEPAD